MKSLKFSALLVAAALYACPAWAPAQERSVSGASRDPSASARDASDNAPRDAADKAARDAAQKADSSARDAGTGAANDARAQAAGAREGAAGAQGQMTDEQAFVRGAASGGMMEVQAAKLALQKAQRPEIKEFAQKLIDDHTKANQKLMQIAQSKQIQVPREMKAGDRGELQDLQELDGQRFEDAFVINQVADHTKMILKFRHCSQKLQDAELKQFAQEQLPGLQEHLQHAQQLAGWDAAQTAGARIRGSSDASSPSQDRSGATPAAGQRNTSGARSGSGTGSGSDQSGVTGSDATKRDNRTDTGTSK